MENSDCCTQHHPLEWAPHLTKHFKPKRSDWVRREDDTVLINQTSIPAVVRQTRTRKFNMLFELSTQHLFVYCFGICKLAQLSSKQESIIIILPSPVSQDCNDTILTTQRDLSAPLFQLKTKLIDI